jgi:GntR family transcriptional repressor for pyruvate dehydrogenase complex
MSDDKQLIRQVDDEGTNPLFSKARFGPVETKNLSQIIIERFIDLLNSGDLNPGQKIPSEKELMETFGVGRSSIREALHSLVALNLLESRAGKGYYAKAPANVLMREDLAQFAIRESDFLDLMEAREKVETIIAELAIQRVTSQDIKKLERIYLDIQRASEAGENLTSYTAKVHLGIAEATHNTVLVRIMKAIIPLIVAKMQHASIPVEEDLYMHKLLIDGLRKGDPENMKELITEHLRVMRNFYMAVMKKQNDSCSNDRLG